MSAPTSNQEPARHVPTAGMTPLDHGQQMYIPDTKPMVNLHVDIPAVGITDTAEGHPIAGPFLDA